MSDSKITLFSFAKYMEDNGDNLFSLMTLPDDIDKDTLTNNILLRGGEFEVVYSDPYFLQKAISIWSSKWYRTFDKWITALNIDYEPLENYNRIENYKDITDKDSGNTRTLNNEDKTTLNNEDKRTLDTTNVAENTVSAYDSSTYQNANKTTIDDDGTITDNHTGTVTDNHTGTIKDEYSDDITFTHSGRIHGNIGVTTSQQMLQSELDIAEWNIYEHITDIFLSEFIIPIYD